MTSDSDSRPTGRDRRARGEARQSGGVAASPERRANRPGDTIGEGESDEFKRTGELLMTFDQPVRKLTKVDGRLFAILADGQTIDVTELLGDAKH